MIELSMRRLIFFIFILLQIQSLPGQNLDIPARDSSNAEKYEYYVNLLKGSLQKNNFWYGFHNTYIAYFHLKAPADTVFKYMHLAIQDDPVNECNTIFKSEYAFFKIAGQSYNPSKMQIVKSLCDSLYASFDSTLMDILTVMYENDQKYRKDSKYDPSVKGNEKYWEEQATLDAVNQMLLQKIIDRRGYPGRQMVGNELEEVAFLVIQHADVKMQEKYLPVIKEAIDRKQLYKNVYPLLIDKIRMRRHLPQIYGTQLIFNKKKDRYELYKVEDLKNIDTLREEYNLMKLSDYLKQTGAVIPDE